MKNYVAMFLALLCFYCSSPASGQKVEKFTVIEVVGNVRMLDGKRLSSLHPMDFVSVKEQVLFLGKDARCSFLSQHWSFQELRGEYSGKLRAAVYKTSNSSILDDLKSHLNILQKLSARVIRIERGYPNTEVLSVRSGKVLLEVPESAGFDPHAEGVLVYRRDEQPGGRLIPLNAPMVGAKWNSQFALETNKEISLWQEIWVGPYLPGRAPDYVLHTFANQELLALAAIEGERNRAQLLLLFFVCYKIRYRDGAKSAVEGLAKELNQADFAGVERRFVGVSGWDRNAQKINLKLRRDSSGCR